MRRGKRRSHMYKKMVPVGLDSFEKIRRLGYYYMDKTLLIQDVLTNRGDVNLFTRPRRFGKTLNMSMLWSFFEIGSDKSLFNGLAISEEKQLCEEYQARHPVVFLSLKGVEGLTYEEAIARLVTLISTECKRLDYLEKAPDVKEDDRKIFRNLMARQPEEDELQDALVTLMRMLHAHYGEQVILLIDEYDVPLDKAHINGYYDQMVAFLRGFFGEAFKTNPDLFFAVVTGCLRISKESIFTGINNLKVDTITDTRYDEYFGFTEADVKKLLADYGMEYALEDMRAWYDGYHFGNADVYCPWDVVNHCDKLLDNPKARPKPYWNNTSSNALVKQFIDMADATTRGEIEQLVAGKTIRKKIVETLTYGELTESIDNLWSVLFLTGYLTVDKNAPEDEDDYTSLVIPNREVREIFIEKIQKWFAEKVVTQKNSMEKLCRALESGDAEQVETMLNEQLRGTISYYDSYEGFYHGFLLGLLKGKSDWTILSNREAGMGRSDIQIENATGELGMIIETKRAKSRNDMEAQCDAALKQILEREYAEPLIDDGANEVWSYGIAFFKKKCSVKSVKIHG